MSYQVSLTGSARSDIRRAAEYIHNELKNPIAADRLLGDAENALFGLREMPHIHSLVQDEFLAAQGIRWVSVRNYIFFFVAREETRRVVVLRFLCARRDWAAVLREE
ncbi:MAG: type II toxin-antitoxin system RelE/ParE family toxin [Oscillospiraceae bacterium]|jgi:plasmid stabilization system protein ParE|nr:type II toxin-antitoxin system RelE/ParE family toxin [Oscillospiraceae bacterium]